MRAVLCVLSGFMAINALGCTELNEAPTDSSSSEDGGLDGGDTAPDGGIDGAMQDGDVIERDAGLDADNPVDEIPAKDGGLDGGDAATDSYTIDVFCEEVERAACAWWTAASSDGGVPCTYSNQFIGTICDGAVQNSIAEGRVTYDPDAARACVALHDFGDEKPKSPTPPVLAALGTGNACDSVVIGAIEADDDCYPAAVLGGSECADGFCAYLGECPSSCIGWRELGDSCDGAFEVCRYGTYCHTELSECVEPGVLDGSCSEENFCADGFYCRDALCKPLEADGVACTSSNQCVSDNCGWTNDDRTEGLCTVRREEGEQCQVTDGCEYPLLCVLGECALHDNEGTCFTNDNCIDDELCMYTGNRGGYFCEVPVPLGATCQSSGPQCEAGSWCSSFDFNTFECMAPGVTGDRCEGSRFCDDEAFYCRSDLAMPVCAARGEQDAPCPRAFFEPCLDGLQCVWSETCEPLALSENQTCSPTVEGSCAEGLFCARDTHTCVPVRAEGGVCNTITYEGCQEGLYCTCVTDNCPYDPSTANANEQCRRKLVDNTVCSSDAQCLSGYCDGVCTEEGDTITLEEVLMCNGL